MIPSLAAYLWTTFFLVITPGATTAVVIQNTVRAGHRGGAAAAAGAALGNASHALLAGIGVAVLLRQHPSALAALRIAGGLYLCWLGIGAFRRARGPEARLLAAERSADRGHRSALRQGLVVNLTNPPIAAFYLTVVPGYLPPLSGPGAFAALAGIHILLAFGCHLGWALIFDRLRRAFERPAALRGLDLIAGAALIFLGARLLGPLG